MPSALMALLLLAATVDPRLNEPLRHLAELHDRDGVAIGAEWARTPRILRLTLRVAPLPPGAGGHYDPRIRTVTMAEALLGEDQRVMADGPRARAPARQRLRPDRRQAARPRLRRAEVRAFEAQAQITRAFWPDELPTGTDWEKGLAMIVTAYEGGGTEGLRAMVQAVPDYQRERCSG